MGSFPTFFSRTTKWYALFLPITSQGKFVIDRSHLRCDVLVSANQGSISLKQILSKEENRVRLQNLQWTMPIAPEKPYFSSEKPYFGSRSTTAVTSPPFHRTRTRRIFLSEIYHLSRSPMQRPIQIPQCPMKPGGRIEIKLRLSKN